MDNFEEIQFCAFTVMQQFGYFEMVKNAIGKIQ